MRTQSRETDTSQLRQRGERGPGPRGDPGQGADGGGAPVPAGAGAEVGDILLALRAGLAPPLLTATDFTSEVRGLQMLPVRNF